MDTCCICHENIESYHKIIEPRCKHKFHVICINIWLSKHRNCPLCRRRVSVSVQIPWRTLFFSMIIINNEMILERASLTYAFLQYILKKYSTPELWNGSKDTIIRNMLCFESSGVILPFLDLSSRTSAKKDYKKWRINLEEISGERAYKHSRVQNAKRILIEKGI